MNKTQIAKEYRIKYGNEMPTLKLARIMFKENSILFTDVEDARNKLRYLEGKYGSSSKNKLIADRPKNPYKFPQSEENNYEPYIIQAKKVLVLSDIHLPYHSIQALTACFDNVVKDNIDAILFNGDILDFYGLSRFVKDPKKRSFAYELSLFQNFIEVVQNTFPNAKMYYKLGNHEERYEHFLWMKAGELEGVDEFSLENIIKKRANVEVIKDKRIIKLGDLNVLHGHEFGGSIFSPVNIARGLFLRAKVSAMQGHNHQTSEHTENNMNGIITTTWSTGCLCELNPAYLPINKWNWGYSIVEVDGDDFHVHNKRIHKGKVL